MIYYSKITLKTKIAIFGGTFSPPHNGHINLVKHVLNECDVDKIIVVPAHIPPHKVEEKVISSNLRFLMAQRAFLNISDKIAVSDFEINQDRMSYTYLTLRHFYSPTTELFLVCGDDMFATLDEWRHPYEIFRLADVIVGSRNDESSTKIIKKINEYKIMYGANISLLRYDPLEISSTDIRGMLISGKSVEKYIPHSVDTFIKENKLYY